MTPLPMHERMSFFEICLASALVFWALGSGLFLFRIPGVHRWLKRCNGCKLFIHWGVFSTGDPSLRAGTFEIVVLDRGPGDQEARNWIAGSGFCWRWRAFGWLPQRYHSSAIQNMGRQFKMWLVRTPPAFSAIEHDARVLREYVGRLHPKPDGVRREIRLMRCFESKAVPDEKIVVLSCPFPAHADGE